MLMKGDDAEEKFREIATAYEVGLLSWYDSCYGNMPGGIDTKG